MTHQTSDSPARYALLIGIDCYLPNRLPDGGYYPSLGGCVRDIAHVEAFLKRTFDLPAEHILKLTATTAGAQEPPEPREQWPTYENMVAAFQQLTAMAQPGDQVYIHYSGHGGRAPTLLPKLKGEAALDEGLVPTDIGDSAARYLRDIELTKLLKNMLAKGLTGEPAGGNAGGFHRRPTTHARPDPGRQPEPGMVHRAGTGAYPTA